MNKLIVAVVALLIAAAGYVVYRDVASTGGDASPYAGDGDGKGQAEGGGAARAQGGAADTVHFWDPATGAGRRWLLGQGAAPEAQALQEGAAPWVPLAVARRGWGGQDALLWLQTDSRALHLWRLDDAGNPSQVEELPYRGTDWEVIAFADANGDGEADLVWRDRQGGVAVWLMRDGRQTEQSPVGDATGCTLALVADLDGDKRHELLWRDDATGMVEAWTLDGVKSAQARPLPGADAAWRPVAAVRVDEDAAEDLVWLKLDTLQLAIWLGGDPARTLLLPRPAVVGWSLAATADVDGDGRRDLVWTHDADGSAGAWRIGADGAVTDLALPVVGTAWQVVPDRVARAGTAPGGSTPVEAEGTALSLGTTDEERAK